MINVIMDTLVFGLQRMGGVSVVWYQYINRMLNDKNVQLTLLDIQQGYINEDFINLDTKNAKHEMENNYNLQLLRNTNPVFDIPNQMSIFQSTYLRTCKRKNVKNVVMIHDITHQLYFRGIKKWLNTVQKKRSITNADGIIYVSENTKNDVEKLYPVSRKKKNVIIYNDATNDYKCLKDIKIPERYKNISGKKYFIYVGDRFDYKNTNILFDVLIKVENMHCVLIGGRDFTETEKDYFSDVKNRIHRFTRVPNQELNILYNAAHCMIFPSHYEGFGIPILEAMRAGCPVIAFKNSSIPEVLGGSGYLLENDDIESIVCSIEELDNGDIRNAIISAQIEYSKRFSWEKSYEQLISFYKEILTS